MIKGGVIGRLEVEHLDPAGTCRPRGFGGAPRRRSCGAGRALELAHRGRTGWERGSQSERVHRGGRHFSSMYGQGREVRVRGCVCETDRRWWRRLGHAAEFGLHVRRKLTRAAGSLVAAARPRAARPRPPRWAVRAPPTELTTPPAPAPAASHAGPTPAPTRPPRTRPRRRPPCASPLRRPGRPRGRRHRRSRPRWPSTARCRPPSRFPGARRGRQLVAVASERRDEDSGWDREQRHCPR